jgi:mono/diheme cytochrome c family protein
MAGRARFGRIPATLALIIGCGSLLATAARQQPTTADAQAGGDVFRLYCASCHGKGGKGDGAIASYLRRPPPDLTLIAKRNGGTFPADQVFKIIDGREPVKGHGGGDMPVWGDAFTRSSEGADPASVKQKIESLVKHLESMQERSPGF